MVFLLDDAKAPGRRTGTTVRGQWSESLLSSEHSHNAAKALIDERLGITKCFSCFCLILSTLSARLCRFFLKCQAFLRSERELASLERSTYGRLTLQELYTPKLL